jgi:nitroreductase
MGTAGDPKKGLLPEIENRFSVKHFLEKKVEKEKVIRILEAGRRAPSAKNRQPWRFIVLEEEENRKKVKNAAYGQEHVGEAPVIIAACTTNIDYRMPNGQLSYPMDISFASAFMMIQAQAENLGTCVVTTFDESEIRNLISVPYSMRVVLLLLIGYFDEKPLQKMRQPLERISSFEHW